MEHSPILILEKLAQGCVKFSLYKLVSVNSDIIKKLLIGFLISKKLKLSVRFIGANIESIYSSTRFILVTWKRIHTRQSRPKQRTVEPRSAKLPERG